MYFLFTMSENPQFSKSAVRFKIYCETLLDDAAGAFAKAVSMITASGGARRDRTDDLMLAKHALSQLSYGPSFAEASEGSPPCTPGWRANRSCEAAKVGGPGKTRTSDLTLIKRAL